ncbi:hypothetical protein AVEN_6118-1 [Araneus ventricosus]|uniref:Uncharacterized protein n=1 Tax=Araneus ventricosus TaxID=182803 RepID=A0A4Y2KPJ2_ARAVE|nr:hypothetical protein AVEN_6118-1 [Araneus ventricosus]
MEKDGKSNKLAGRQTKQERKSDKTAKAQTTEQPMNGKDESVTIVLVEVLEMRPATKNPRIYLGISCTKANNAVAEQLGGTILLLT